MHTPKETGCSDETKKEGGMKERERERESAFRAAFVQQADAKCKESPRGTQHTAHKQAHTRQNRS